MYSDEVSMDHWWNNTDRAKPEYQEKKVFQRYFAYLKSHLDWSEIEPWSQVPEKSEGLYCFVQ
jgi:hypothetical protein